jgi:hypothetical protein
MKNKLTDLNDHLFAQLERLSDETLTGEALEAEVKRGAAVVAVADAIVRGGDLHLRAVKMMVEHGGKAGAHLPMIGAAAGAK